jgi:hypothetical protein
VREAIRLIGEGDLNCADGIRCELRSRQRP